MNKNRTALIVDKLWLHAIEKERLEAAQTIADNIEIEYNQLTLVKVYRDKYVYVADLDERFEHEAIAVDAVGEGVHTYVYSSKKNKETIYFISEELNSWRYDFYMELLKIVKEEKEQNGFNQRWAFEEAACLSIESLVEAMTWNDPKNFAEIVSM